jgi:hypothetical protein
MAAETARRRAEVEAASADLQKQRLSFKSQTSDLQKKQVDAERAAAALSADSALAERLRSSVQSKAAALSDKQAALTAFGAALDSKALTAQQFFESRVAELSRSHDSMLSRLSEVEESAMQDLVARANARLRAVGDALSTAAQELEGRFARRVSDALAATRATVLAAGAQEAEAMEHLQVGGIRVCSYCPFRSCARVHHPPTFLFNLQTVRSALADKEVTARREAARVLERDRLAVESARQALTAQRASVDTDKARLDQQAATALMAVQQQVNAAIADATSAGQSAILAARKTAEKAVAAVQAETARRLDAERASADKQERALIEELAAREASDRALTAERLDSLQKARDAAAKEMTELQKRVGEQVAARSVELGARVAAATMQLKQIDEEVAAQRAAEHSAIAASQRVALAIISNAQVSLIWLL